MITTAEAKTFLGVTTTANDTLISSFIDYVTAEIEAVVGHKLIQAVYTDEVLNFDDAHFDAMESPSMDLTGEYPQIFLKNYPVQSLTITENGTAVSTDNYTVETDAKNRGVVTFYAQPNTYHNYLKATYTAGFTTTTGSTFTVPNDLKKVALDGVKEMYQASGTTTQSGSTGVKSKSVGDFSVSYGDSQVQLNGKFYAPYIAKNMAILNAYKKTTV